MKIKEILSLLEEIAPLAYAEDFDNVGLLVGDSNNQATGVLVCHDALEIVIDEAIAKKCNLIVCFHPILFSGLKKNYRQKLCRASCYKSHKKRHRHLCSSHRFRQPSARCKQNYL